MSLGASRTAGAEPDVHDPVSIESWDGTPIAATVYEPAGPGPHPAVLMTHGYSGTRANAAGTAHSYAAAGYVVLTYDSRGFGDSGGESSFDGPKEVADALTLIDRLGDGSVGGVDVEVRSTDNGPAVGMDGGSYAGGIQLNTAAATPSWFREADTVDFEQLDGTFKTVSLRTSPLDAIVPRITWNDLLQSAAPNGVVKAVWDAFILAGGAEGYERNDRPDPYGPDPRLYEYTAKAAATNEVPEEAEAYFAKRSPNPATIADNGVPALLVQGWPDNLLPPNQALANFHGIAAAGGDAAIAFFPGGHDDDLPVESDPPREMGGYLSALALAWMDRHVAGDASRWNEGGFPTVSIYQQQYPDVPSDDEGTWAAWREESAWPPAEAASTALDLATASASEATVLGNPVAPTSVRGPTGSLFGAPGADAPGGSAAFDFVATDTVDVVGTPRLSLAVTPLGDDPVVFAKAKLVDGPGRATVVDEQVMPYRIRDFPGRRTQVAFDMVAFQRYLSDGQRFRLVLSTTDNGYASSRTAPGLIVHHDQPGASTLTLQTISETTEPFEGAPPTE